MSRHIGEDVLGQSLGRSRSPMPLALLAAWIVVTACAVTPVAETPTAAGEEQESIGVATMDASRAITLRLRAEGPGGLMGESLFVYPPSHEDYQYILDHLGGLEPGQSKPVPPFPKAG